MRIIRLSGLLAVAAWCALSATATQVHAADQGITGKKLLLKVLLSSPPKLVVISKDPSVSITGSDPVGGADSSITLADGTNAMTFSLPASGWSANGAGTLFKYKNAAAPGGPSVVKIAKLKSGLLKVIAKGLPFPVPSGAATIDVVLSLDGGTRTYCMTFAGTGDGIKFLVKDATAGSCCGDNIQAGGEVCDGSDASACPGYCQSDCTCPVCGDNVAEGTEECDGSDDAACPALCLGNCTCDASAAACCDYGGTCGGSVAGVCTALGGTPIGGGPVCNASGSCGAPAPYGGCCEVAVPQVCGMPSDFTTCPGTFNADAICLPSGKCAAPCEATTGGFCWFIGAAGESCDAKCAAVGRVYDSATRTFAGSDGTDANCTAVFDDLGVPAESLSTTPDCTSFGGGIGCAYLDAGGFGNARMRCLAPPTDSMSMFAIMYRVCACQ